jgi:hypothetical protein
MVNRITRISVRLATLSGMLNLPIKGKDIFGMRRSRLFGLELAVSGILTPKIGKVVLPQ